MQFEETKYVSIELTTEEKAKLSQARDVLLELIDYMQTHDKDTLDYKTYDGTEILSIKGLINLESDLENIYNVEGVE